MDTFRRRYFTVGVGKYIKLASPRTDFLQVRFQFFQKNVIRSHGDDRHVLVHQGQRAVLQLSCRVGLGMDVGVFLEFERTFESNRVMPATPEEQRILLHGKVLGPLPDLRFKFEHPGNRLGQVPQMLQFSTFRFR